MRSINIKFILVQLSFINHDFGLLGNLLTAPPSSSPLAYSHYLQIKVVYDTRRKKYAKEYKRSRSLNATQHSFTGKHIFQIRIHSLLSAEQSPRGHSGPVHFTVLWKLFGTYVHKYK